MPVELTPSQESYLEWIYRLSEDGRVRVRDLAARLGVRLPSASRAVSQLTKRGLITHKAYGDIVLTEAGRRAGSDIVRRNRCLTRLFEDILAMGTAEAQPMISRLGHHLGPEALWRLELLVGFSLSSDAWIRRLQHRIHAQGRRRRLDSAT